MGHDTGEQKSGNLDSAFEGGTVRATWRLSLTGESAAVRDLAAVRTSADAPTLKADQHFRSDLPGALMDSLDVTAGTNGGTAKGS